jgi:hypothetical protein
MSDEQDVRAPGWVDPQDGRTGATAAAVVPGQRTEGEPVQATPPVLETPVEGAPPGSNAPAEEPPPGAPRAEEPPADVPRADVPHEPRSTPYPTTPVNVGVRPRPRMPRGDPLIRMGPWAPVAGATVGLVLGILVVLLLAPVVDTFDQRLALVFVVLGLCLLGAGGTLLADEVRLLRRGAQAAEARAASVGAIAGLLNGLTPARLMITASAFAFLLSAYVTGRG